MIVGPSLAAVDPRFTHVFVCAPSQLMKTQWMFNVAGQTLDDAPAPVLWIAPTKNNALEVIEPKVDAMLRQCASLWAKTTKGQKYAKLRKIVASVPFRLAWAGSPTEIASDNACIVLVDEIDRVPKDVKGEGSVIDMADARHTSFPDGRTLGASSPTEANVETYVDERTGMRHWKPARPEDVISTIWRLWQEGSRHEWAVPCPSCRDYFIPRFRYLIWKEKATPIEAERTAKLGCACCGELIDNDHREWMNARGVYVAPGQKPKRYRRNSKHATIEDHTGATVVEYPVEFGGFVWPADAETRQITFWISGVMHYSDKNSFGRLASAYVKAARTGEDVLLKGVVNTKLGECWHFGGDAPTTNEVLNCRGSYVAGRAPDGVVYVTMTVDVQKDRLIYSIRGWGAGHESWLLDNGDLWGDTDRDEVWSDLDELLNEEVDGHRISACAIDSGYRAPMVYAFVRAHRKRCYATKGHDTLAKPFYMSRIDVDGRDGKTAKNGLSLWHFDADHFKTEVHDHITRPQDQPGAWHLPADVPEQYASEILAEERVAKPSGLVTWVRRSRQNHALDCEALHFLLAAIKRRVIRRLARRRLRSLEAPRGEGSNAAETAHPVQQRLRHDDLVPADSQEK